MSTIHRTHHVGAALITGLALALTGCGSVKPDPRPEVIWPDGEPTGPLEDDPWVQAVRTSYLELDIAIATRDFSAPALRDTAPIIRRETHAHLEDSARERAWAFTPGPRPLIPIHVDEAPNGKSATVITCYAADWYITAEDPEPPTDPRGVLLDIPVTIEDGRRMVEPGVLLNDDVVMNTMDAEVAEAAEPFLDPREDRNCLLDDAPRGYFDPAPDVTLEYSPDDIKF
ncbi:hypothetical protein ACFO6V_15185 [Promicromonospora alba]|uniref:Lipoprotein n=1 Tax=Promicromonospora alba TaxID=1616110 RepID=A0ABV9HI43_9MICO